ncbi:hypothetical protein F3087_39455 [Nocardia colli]|uniref:DUF3159 domain-containing protein n=1 Tax=Nocardia colli TaxID=2545717 RepID=A0A5N0DYA1_9NOCA|nr:VC0807 family protein [Nocardia colli]KAA8882128.1 hypothetical protein F3087_39455 [Nocardia colli]
MNSPQTLTAEPTQQQKRAAVRRHLARQIILELVLPLGGYYALRAAGVNPWAALILPTLLIAGLLVYHAIRERRIDAFALFVLSMIVLGSVMTLVTGDPRTLMVRDSWIFGLLGLWMLGSLLTQRPFMRVASRAIVTAKIGEEGYRQWDARWDNDSQFRYHLRVLTAVWGAVFLLDAFVRVLLAYTLPIDAIPLVSTVQWLVVLAALITFHNFYLTKHGLKA